MVERRRKREQRASKGPAQVVRRRPDSPRGLRKLPSDLEDLAAGRRDVVLRPRRRPRGQIADSRVAGLVPGVANHEARRVYDARLARCLAAHEAGDEPELARLLCDAWLLGLWRARSVTGFDAFAQHVVGIDPERAVALAEQSAAERGLSLERLPDVGVALWLRSEAALCDRCPEARVEVERQDDGVVLRLGLPLAPVERLTDAVVAVGRSASGLSRVLATQRPRKPDKPRSE